MGACPDTSEVHEWIQLGCSEDLPELRQRAARLAACWPDRYTLVIVRTRLTPRPTYSLMLRHAR